MTHRRRDYRFVRQTIRDRPGRNDGRCGIAGGETDELGVCGVVVALAVTGGSVAAPSRSEGVLIEVTAGRYERRDTPVFFSIGLGPQFQADASSTTGKSSKPRCCRERRRAWPGSSANPCPPGRPAATGSNPPTPDGTARAGRDLYRRRQSTCGSVSATGRCFNTMPPWSSRPRGSTPYYRRSGQIHPLYTPTGRVVSDDFPPDHAHQHGVFFAWVNTTFEGRHLDFWNQKEQTGRIEHATTLGTGAGRSSASSRSSSATTT